MKKLKINSKLVFCIVAILSAIGITGLFKMNRDEFPLFQLKQGLIAGIYPGASAEEVRTQLTEPLEDVLMSCQEVNRNNLKSYSKDGICYIYADLNTPASTKDIVWSKLKLKLNTAKLTLPAGVLAVVVLDDFSETSALLISMESDDKGTSEILYHAKRLKDRLMQIPELAKASILGEQTEEIAVTLDIERLSRYGISPSSLMLQFQSATLSTSSGKFDTDYANAPIHIVSNMSNEEEIEEKIVYTDPSGTSLRLKDVATIERKYKDNEPFVSHNGKTAIVMNISMLPNNNIVDFGEKVEKVLEEFSEELPESIKLKRITDQPKAVRTSILGFVRDLFISMLVVILVMLMLFPMRSALIAGSGVPVCTAVTLAIMYILGMQLNTVTLASLIVVLGMIVDDSIITMDGYMDKLNRGLSNREAASASSRELFMPMFMATFAISAMFFPSKYLIKGYLGDFISVFPWVIAMALACSLAYAMLVVPSMEIHLIKSADITDRTFIARAQKVFFDWMQRIYNKAESFCFRHPAWTIGGGVLAVALGIYMFMQLNIQMMPKANRDCFAVEVFLDSNASIDETSQVCDSLTKLLLADPRITGVSSFVGTSAPRFHSTYSPSLPGDNVAQLIVNTKSNLATTEVLPVMEEKYEHWFPRALVHFRQMDYQGTLAIEIMLKGDRLEDIQPYADSLRNFMYGMDDELKWVHSDCDDMNQSVRVTLKADEAARLGVNKTVTSLTLAGIFNGETIGTIWEGDRKVPINIYSSTGLDTTMSYEEIGEQLIPSLANGGYVPLKQVADLEPEWNYSQLPRYSGKNGICIYADMKYRKSQPAAMKKIRKYIKEELDLPDDITVSYGGLDSANSSVFPQIAMSFLAAVLILFVFLLINFKKVGIAVLTLALSMLCLFGASFGLWAFGMDFSMTAVLGLISLVGIIVRNGIIMFEYAEELRFEQGKSVYEAALLAGQRRMRPIFLTSCTTALGVLPMIISGDLLWMPMGLVICFGTLLSIALIVLIMPVSYWQIFKKADSHEKA
ncbi:MAG: efflux RND transporter permease subunit [Bacteroidales bacterium]|nr:efflux RND transporter permease subunit [Candidatus Cryptobacteroides equifaecalis]